ncbi:hypothetical protein [Parvularcula maris]|uniref:Uncharacterized protein n=1 Tax=Parvularcula maris TaxID=2965077 RepID=A0A9X2RJB9_9PROT|nr:hypothetical protein [Parvularcula maris]MCQ8185776.1 hypothetical protein [Parvularcula maris]
MRLGITVTFLVMLLAAGGLWKLCGLEVEAVKRWPWTAIVLSAMPFAGIGFVRLKRLLTRI